MEDKKELKRGSVVFMKASSGLVGYGNGQCVSSVCEPLGTISLFGHNQEYSIYDIERIVESPPSPASKAMRELLERWQESVEPFPIVSDLKATTKFLKEGPHGTEDTEAIKSLCQKQEEKGRKLYNDTTEALTQYEKGL